MPKFAVVLITTAVVDQVQYVEAENAHEARKIALDNQNNEVWELDEVFEQAARVVDVQEKEEE